jgi:outer membrane protein insertion porin family
MLVLRLIAALLVVLLPAMAQRPAKPRKPAAPKPEPVKTLPADPTKPFTLGTIVVTGNQNFTADQVIAMSGLEKGKLVKRDDFDAAQQRLLESGLFETIAYRYEPSGTGQEYRATLEVKEIAQIFPYRFEAVAGDEKAMRAWLKEKEPLFGDRIPATEPVIRRFASALTEFFKKNGSEMDISGRLLPNDKGQLEVVFQPSSLPSVAEVQFKGHKVFDLATLQQTVSGTAIGAVYTEARFRQILDSTIRPLYESEGRLRVTFPQIETKPATGVKGIAVTVTVNEGDPYKLTDVRLTGPLGPDKGLMREGAFLINEVVNMKAVNDGTDRIEAALKRRGYLSARSVTERKIDDEKKTVSLTVEVDPGPQYKMGQLTIEGLDIQTEPEIRKMWALKPNQPFNAEYPDLFLSKMPELMDNLGKTRAAVNPDPGTLKVDVILIFSAPEKKKPERQF